MLVNHVKAVLCLAGLMGLLPGIAQAQGLKVALQADDGTYFARL
jgi:hypothetical protein